MRKANKMLLAGIVVILAAVTASCAGGGKRVGTSAVLKEAVEDKYTEEGRISFGKEYRVITQVSGPVKEIIAEENAHVEKGQVLFTIDSANYEYQKSMNESDLSGLEAQLEQGRINKVMTSSPREYIITAKQEMIARKADYVTAKRIYEGSRHLYQSGAISKSEWEGNEAAYKNAYKEWQQALGRFKESERQLNGLKQGGIDQENINDRFYNSQEDQLTAQIEAKKTLITQLEDQIANCQVKAECDGIITSLPVKSMSVIQSGETAAIIGGREGTEAEADVLTSIAPYIKEGGPVEVTIQLRGKDETYTGKVSGIYDYASRGVSSLGLEEYRVHVKVALDGVADLGEKDGYGVNLKFLLYSNKDCLTIPSSAVFKTGDQYYVFEIKGGKAVKVPIQVEYQTGTKTVVSGGLKQGERVISQVDSKDIFEGARVSGK